MTGRRALGAFAVLLLAASPCGAAPAKGKGKPGLPMGNRDNRSPIEITADALEVLQLENKAIFKGHVVAVQQDMRLKADSMTVFYRKPDGSADTPAAKPDPLTGGQQDAIQRIVAEGGVFLSTANETASGAKGTYDVQNHVLRLDDEVVLTRDRNVLKGDHLTYNLDTGESVMSGGVTRQAGTAKGRVRALFVPGSEGDKGKPAKETP